MRARQGNDAKLENCGDAWRDGENRRKLPRTRTKKNEHSNQKTANALSLKGLTPATIDGVLMGWFHEVAA